MPYSRQPTDLSALDSRPTVQVTATEFSGEKKKREKKTSFPPERRDRPSGFDFPPLRSRDFLGFFMRQILARPPQHRRRHGLHFAHRQRSAQERPENEPNPVSSERGEWVRVKTVETIFDVFFLSVGDRQDTLRLRKTSANGQDGRRQGTVHGRHSLSVSERKLFVRIF